VLKILSGGQTGVDRAALDAALELGLPCGGSCPKGRKAEDGRIPDRYPLTKKATAAYPARTKRNVADAGGTLILTVGEPEGGTLLTLKECKRTRKPHLVIDLDQIDDRSVEAVRSWLEGIRVVNVASPRESKRPGLYSRAKAFLLKVFGGHGEGA
jgi:hypothetical protein